MPCKTSEGLLRVGGGEVREKRTPSGSSLLQKNVRHGNKGERTGIKTVEKEKEEERW